MTNKLIKPTLIIALIVLVMFPAYSQKNRKSLKSLVKETIELQRIEKYSEGLSPFKDYIIDSAQAMINNFKPYATDTVESVRSLAYDAIGVTGLRAKNLKIRQSAVDILVNACLDKEAAMRKIVAKKLTHFLKPDFTTQSKQKLAALLKLENVYYQNTIKLVGFLDMTAQIPVLKEILDSGQIRDKTLEWDIHLSLARLGDIDEINYCNDLIRGSGLNDKIVYNLFPDLVYIRSRESIDYMLEILNSDSKDCFSPNPDNPVKITCAYRAMEYLAPIIKNYPLKRNKGGELNVDDYENALITCREWFKTHAYDFVIDKDCF